MTVHPSSSLIPKAHMSTVGESSHQAASSSFDGLDHLGGNAQPIQWTLQHPILDESSNSPDVLFSKLVKLKRKIRLLKKRALFIQRELRWLKNNDHSSLAFHRIRFYKAELASRRDALDEAVTAHEYAQWHLNAVVAQTI
ncbi:hypothetical protein A1Q1_00668 [Trichosporon asahii var. asahii CBS 2479]|uniref:Uncharacterized protein n=1 Tax=Trichosporon asahii var. asahii (strain ATCC 90039 / CBS 2479 / JCM 2466 / KCTC 7840 / NBRC 103889/ NCYC 2677 / UAMH 7654) TaxID=1186058 RepID=J5TUH0_TRIAS|nr:hypothetical protein A1Q1_00668 [Trichosporon asahii var. asahii CBS 2479]EJT52921.1 hypothetical protein A1Q1_00668 [Trichosporon asahii var. asahii CBS 2479]